MRLCGNEAVSAVVQTVKGGMCIAADTPGRRTDGIEAGDHLFMRLKARMPQDIRQAECRQTLTLDAETFASQFEEDVDHRQHSLNQ